METTVPSPDVTAVLVEHHRRFLRFLERRVQSREVAEDILQDAFVRSMTRAPELPDSESAVAWFYRVLRNALIDHYRHEGAEQRAYARAAAEQDTTTAPIDAELFEEVCACVRGLVATLKPEFATAITDVDLGGVSLRAFADAQGITTNNAAVRLHRAHRALKQQIVQCCGTCADHGCYRCECRRQHRLPAKAGSHTNRSERGFRL